MVGSPRGLMPIFIRSYPGQPMQPPHSRGHPRFLGVYLPCGLSNSPHSPHGTFTCSKMRQFVYNPDRFDFGMSI